MENIFNDTIKPFISKMRRKRYLNDYYLRRIKDGKSKKAILIDSIFFKILIVFLTYGLLLYYTKKWAVSLSVSILFVILYSLISYKIKKIKINEGIYKVNQEIGKERVLSQIKTLSKYEFVDYSKEILEKYYDTEFSKYEKEIDLIGKIYGDIYGIKTIKKNLDEKVNLKELEEFICELENNNINKSIVLTNSYFSEKLKESICESMTLLDFDSIVKMLKKIGSYATQEDIEDLIYNRFIEKRKSIMKDRKNFFTVEKIIKYFVLGLMLWFLSKIVSYCLYYKLIGAICIILGIIGTIIRIFNFFKSKEDAYLQK